ncbi:hypothetical protein N311_10840, partial [Apaloderma vittatum]
GSAQTLELQAVVSVFEHFSTEPIHIICDSLYVVGIVQRIERAFLKEVQNKQLWQLLLQLWHILNIRQQTYFIAHIRSHLQFQDGLFEGNDKADRLVSQLSIVPEIYKQALLSHEFFHQSAQALAQQFNLSLSKARNIVAACPSCAPIPAVIGTTVNPRGLGPLELWQTDITMIPSFKNVKQVHVTIDTFSQMIWATALTKTNATAVQRHWLQCFAVMGIPKTIKTDNGSGYIAASTQQFLQKWGVKHVTGIPANSTGQAIIERTHHTLKQ